LTCWFEGVHLDLLCNNNGIEVLNRTIKDEGTFRERLSMLHFMKVVFKMICKWSRERNPNSPNCYAYATEPVLELKDWTDAYMWAKANVPTMEHRVEGRRFLVFFSREANVRLTPRKVERIIELHLRLRDFVNYEEVKMYLNEVRVVGESYTCSCKFFKKEFTCKHVVGAQIREKGLQVPIEAKTIPMGHKRTRGRVSRARSALQRQN
jgi:hypothetical protein